VGFGLLMTNVLVFGYGNLSIGDDALGPLLIEYIEKHVNFSGLEIITDFQLQIEHALDLEGRDLVLFVGAAVGCDQPDQFSRLAPEKDRSYTSHAMSPTSVLSVYQDVVHKQPPPCFLLSIQALNFELGTDLSEQARLNLGLAEKFVQQLLGNPELGHWLKLMALCE
jgi:hydrogenase maturation protease